MIELIFVIVILGILAAVAIPRLAGTRADAEITSAIANIRTFLSDAGTFYVAKGSFFEGTPTDGTNLAQGDYVKYNQFTNVPLYEPTVNGAKIGQNKTVEEMAAIAVGGKPCLKLGVLDPLENASVGLSSAIVLFSTVDGANSSLCNAVKNAEAVKAFTHNMLLDKNGQVYDFINSDQPGMGFITGAIGIGSSASVYDLNYTPGN